MHYRRFYALAVASQLEQRGFNVALSKNDLIALVANTIDTNGNEEITAADFRAVMEQMIDSGYNQIDDFLGKFELENDSGTVSQAIATGGSLNLNTLWLDANETTLGVVPTFKNISNVTQATFNDEANDKFLFPSNLYTFNNGYVPYGVRVLLVISHGALTTTPITISVAIKRVVDDSLVTETSISMSNEPITAAEDVGFNLFTRVGNESDPYVVDGCYIEVRSGSASPPFTILNANISIFKS
jgi:hypothetical protein